jgi:hypothetical protein
LALQHEASYFLLKPGVFVRTEELLKVSDLVGRGHLARIIEKYNGVLIEELFLGLMRAEELIGFCLLFWDQECCDLFHAI